MVNSLPTGTQGHPEKVARAILGFIENDYVTGSEIVIDGGLLLK